MRLKSWRLTAATAASVLVTSLVAPTPGNALPKMYTQSKVEKLAEKIDKLQKHIDEYGTVVAKSPDVWGQSRLMQHRIDVERELAKKLDKFVFGLNATEISRDSAFLASALALQGALNSSTKVSTDVNSVTTNLISNPVGASGTTPDTSTVIRTGAGPGFSNQFVSATGSGTRPVSSISIEPTIELDQLKRYLDHLNQLRRNNEGDDTADSPGYSLNLVRIPISILPGKKTRQGYGAEITVTIKPHLSDELLPMAFKDLVINGLADRISPTVMGIADRAPIFAVRRALRGYYQSIGAGAPATTNLDNLDRFEQSFSNVLAADLGRGQPDTAVLKLYGNYLDVGKYVAEFKAYQALMEGKKKELAKARKDYESKVAHMGLAADVRGNLELNSVVELYKQNKPLPSELYDDVSDPTSLKREFLAVVNKRAEVMSAEDTQQREGVKIIESVNVSQIRLESGGVKIRSKLAIPATHHRGINGHTLYRVALDVFDNQAQSPDDTKLNHLDEMLPGQRGLDYQDVHSFVRSEAQAAYAFLCEPSAAPLWELCGPNLARAVREQRRRITETSKDAIQQTAIRKKAPPIIISEDIKKIRANFFELIENLFPESKDSVTAALAWHIIVESSLLNEQLVADMRELASTKNCNCLSREWMQFYGPIPPPESRAAFNQYVECRWPIHVFALDPVTQDQNIGEAFSRRREMQLVLALAASNKRMGVQSMTRFIRRLEYDLETIELNRTEIGFSHGDDTFGWRFYPRVQAPPVPGNLRATGELLFGGPSRERDLLSRKLEPGMRECVAIVVMPSFVPYVTVDTRSNWFLLTKDMCHLKNAGHREMDLKNAVNESREIVELRQLAQACFKDAEQYRDGEIYRLQRAVDQLDRQLPLQTAYIQMPYENTLGGFEMFNTGVTDLAPELHGWYGAPGLVVGGPSSDAQTTSSIVARLWEKAAQLSATAGLAEAAKDPKAGDLRTAADNAAKAAAAAQGLANNAGLNPSGKTTVFLVGKNFSVLRNKVIAGGAAIPEDDVKVISRQVMQVTIPWGLNTVDIRGRRFVDVHLATPYGATSHLHVPVANDLPSQLNDAKAEIIDEAKKQSLEATKKQTAEAVAPFSQQVATSFQWEASDSQVAYIQYDTHNNVAEFGLNSPGISRISNKAELPNVPGFRLTKAESAWFVELEFEGGKKGFVMNGSKKSPLGPYLHEFSSGVIELRSNDPEKEAKVFEDLADVLKKNVVASQKLKVVRLHGFLRFRDQLPAVPDKGVSNPGQDVLPIYKLDPLTIEVVAAAKVSMPSPTESEEAFSFPAP